MEKATYILNLASAVILLAAGAYVQTAFSPLLAPSVKVLMALVLGVYFLMRLNPFWERNQMW